MRTGSVYTQNYLLNNFISNLFAQNYAHVHMNGAT